MLKIDYFYITVSDLNKAIDFYRQILQKDVSHREENRWADFQEEDGQVYFGIYNATVDDEKYVAGSSLTLCLKTDDANAEYERIKQLKPSSISEIVELTQPARYFQFADE